MKNLKGIFTQVGHIPGTNKSLLNDLDGDSYKMAVLRNPIDSVISLYVHSAYVSDGSRVFSLDALKMFISSYVDYHNVLEQHSDKVEFYRFEDLEKIVFHVASKFVEVPEGYVLEPTEDEGNNYASIKATEFYEEVMSSINDYSIFDPAFDIYNRLVQKASIIV